jgi:23S rRNA (guanosine2251-2'-O)-methyltransferase
MSRRGGSNRDAGRREPRSGPETPGSRRTGDRREDLGGQVEGIHAVRELLEAGRRRVKEVWLVERADGADELEELAAEAGARVRLVSPTALAAKARSEAPQGVIAFAAPVRLTAARELLDADDAFIVALDGVTDPGNLGAILRSAETAGVTGVVLPAQRSARLGPTALKAAAGAIEHLSVATVSGIAGFVDLAKRSEVWTVALDAAGTVDVHDLAVATGPVVLVLGAEGAGVSRLVRERCDVVASIPMYGRLESLNVSAAAAVALHAVARTRRSAAEGSL